MSHTKGANRGGKVPFNLMSKFQFCLRVLTWSGLWEAAV